METLNSTQIVDEPETAESAPFKLDLGCGPNKKEGFYGVDSVAFDGVDQVVDLKGPWPWDDESVDETNAHHVFEHFNAMERVHFINELYRVLKPGGTAFFVCPHWASQRAYGDPTHQWPPVCGFGLLYYIRFWRDNNAPHTDHRHVPGMFNCNFSNTCGYGIHPEFQLKSREAREFAMQFNIEATPDIMFTLTKEPMDKDF